MSAYDSVLEVTPQPLAQFEHEAACSDGIDFQSLEVGTTVRVHTRYSSPRQFESKVQRLEARL